MRARTHTGQATVEAVALWLLLAGLLALLGAWASSHMRPPGGPPPVVERAARPLLGADGANHLPLSALVPRGVGDPVALRVLRRADRIARSGYQLQLEAQSAFADGFLGRLRQRGQGLVTDPVGRALGVAPYPQNPADAAQRDGRAAGPALERYVDELAHSSPREAGLRVARDLGRLAADETLRRLTRAAGRGAWGRARDRDQGSGRRPDGSGTPGDLGRIVDLLLRRRSP